MPRMAATDARQAGRDTFENTVTAHRLGHVHRASRVKPAGARQTRRDEAVITEEQQNQRGASHSLYLRRWRASVRARSSSATTQFQARAPAPLRAITTKSVAGGKAARRRRKNSRTRRLMRFRTTELPTLPLTVIPSRVSSLSFGQLITTKCAVWTLTPARDSLRNSARLLRRAVFGNRSVPFSDLSRDEITCVPAWAARSPLAFCVLWRDGA